MRKHMWGFVPAILTAILLGGCGSEVQPAASPDTSPDVVLQRAGEIHNRVVEAFYELRPAGEKLSPSDFVATMAVAANTGLERSGVDEAVDVGDIESVIAIDLEIRERSGYDLLSARTGDPVLFVNFAEHEGWVTAIQAEALRQFIENNASSDVGIVPLGSEFDAPPMNIFLDIYQASGELWPSLHARYDIGPGADDRIRTIGTRLVDGLASLAKLHPILRLLNSVLISTLFEEAYDAGAFDGYRDPCTPCWSVSP